MSYICENITENELFSMEKEHTFGSN